MKKKIKVDSGSKLKPLKQCHEVEDECEDCAKRNRFLSLLERDREIMDEVFTPELSRGITADQ